MGIRTGVLTQMVVDKYGGSHGAENLAKYIPLTQVASSTGGANNIADVMVLGAWKSSGNLLEGFEVKVSRADWLNEVKNPDKCVPTKKFCDKWWLVIADRSMVKEGELPDDWGMMVVEEDIMGTPVLKVAKQAPRLEAEPMTHDFVASLLRTDARGQIAIDVHNDQMKDAVRDAEAKMKKKYDTLMEYVKFLNKAFGIKLEKSDWSEQWSAKVKQGYGTRHFTQDQLIDAIKHALGEDIKNMSYQFERMKDYALQVIKIADDTKDSRR